jgi:hypothetical protein
MGKNNMSKYEYDDKDYYDELDDVAFHAERIMEKVSERKYLDMSDRELIRNAFDVCLKLRGNKIG